MILTALGPMPPRRIMERAMDAKNERVSSVTVLEFDPPFEHLGEKIERLTFDYSRLTAQDLIDVGRSIVLGEGVALQFPELDLGFHAEIAAKAANVTPDVIKALPGSKGLDAMRSARRFLHGVD